MIDEQTRELLLYTEKAEQASIAKSQLLATMNGVNWQGGMVVNHFLQFKSHNLP